MDNIRFNTLILCLQSLSNILKEYELEDYDLSVVFELKINFFQMVSENRFD